MEKDAFRLAVESHQIDEMINSFSDDAVLHSPVSFRPVEGHVAIRKLFTILTEEFQDFHYTDQLDSKDGARGLIFRAKIDNLELEGLDLLRFDSANYINDFTVMIRPRSAIEVICQIVGKRLSNIS